MAELKLISFKICPYVQRSVITLLEKGVQHAIEYIDLADKPAWFLELSPTGKVPVLQVDGAVLFESAVINEYLDETTPEPRLMPGAPLLRAKNRAWIEMVSNLLVLQYKLSMAKDEAACRALAREVNGKLGLLAKECVGPWFNGERFSLVDSAVAPLLQRLSFCAEVRADLGLFEGLPQVSEWRDRLLERPSVAGSTVPEIRDLYRAYLAGGGSPARRAEPSWLGGQAG